LLIATIYVVAIGLLLAALGAPSFASVTVNLVALATAVGAWQSRPLQDDQSSLIAEVSHELRTPLTGILGTLELLTESTVPLEPSEVDELLLAAHGEANHLLHVVGNLHARSRLDRSILKPEEVATDLRAIVKKAVSRSPSVTRRCFFSPGAHATAVGDPQLIMQVVTNLIQNIERYAPDGPVRIAFSLDNGCISATFTDAGPGIPSYRAERIFTDAGSSEGLGLGLSLSRQLARAMGGDLTIDNPGSSGAAFRLRLPASAEQLPPTDVEEVVMEDKTRAYSPRSRLLIDLAAALSERTLDNVVGGIQKLYSELLGATGALLLVARPDGSFLTAGPYGGGETITLAEASQLAAVVSDRKAMRVENTDDLDWATESVLGGSSAMLLPVNDGETVVGVLAVGWKSAELLPQGAAAKVTTALADQTAPAVARAALSEDIIFERRLRSSVMNELPIAVSIFVGDPPQVVDMNRKEREMLLLDDLHERPRDLETSQDHYSVRFADGTPLTVDNAPVTRAIRTGKATGPFMLIVRRADGSQIHTRTYCAPFFDDAGEVAGAVVTSEPLDIAVAPEIPD
jgi:K+-sensing histidine kinase KdpD